MPLTKLKPRLIKALIKETFILSPPFRFPLNTSQRQTAVVGLDILYVKSYVCCIIPLKVTGDAFYFSITVHSRYEAKHKVRHKVVSSYLIQNKKVLIELQQWWQSGIMFMLGKKQHVN